MKYVLYNTNNRKTEILSVKEIIDIINQDRGPEWIDYNETDWEEGLLEFTDYIILDEWKGGLNV